MGAWRPRVARDDKGKLHLVYARYDDGDPYARCGMASISGVFNEADTIDQMKRYAQRLVEACGEPIIPMEEYGIEPNDEDEEEEDF